MEANFIHILEVRVKSLGPSFSHNLTQLVYKIQNIF